MNQRERVAKWYDQRARESDSGAVSVMFHNYAVRIRKGLADHRLTAIEAGQRDFDAGIDRLTAWNSPDANQICSWCETPAQLETVDGKVMAKCRVCHTCETWWRRP